MKRNPSRFTGDLNRPVDSVSWKDCQEFCSRLSSITGRKVRLPSEAEWEYACRAGTVSLYYFGELSQRHDLGRYAWYEANSGKTTHPAGQKIANDWGLHDMLGNVAEWCQDAWLYTFLNAPVDGSAWTNAQLHNQINFRMTRGGGYDSDDQDCECRRRKEKAVVLNSGNLGLRVAVDANIEDRHYYENQ